jgi:hypothetical protein
LNEFHNSGDDNESETIVDVDLDVVDTTDQLTDRFEAQIRPMVRSIRATVEGQIFSESANASVGNILRDAPTEMCVQLADAWSIADLVGVSAEDLLSRFDAIDRFVIEMVTGIYSNSKCELFGPSAISVFDTGRFNQPAGV